MKNYSIKSFLIIFFLCFAQIQLNSCRIIIGYATQTKTTDSKETINPVFFRWINIGKRTTFSVSLLYII